MNIKGYLREVVFAQVHWLPRYYALFKWVKFNKEDVVLDVGCGEGIVSFKLAALCKRAIGLDLSAKNIRVAESKKKSSRLKQKIDFILGDILRLPFEDNTFDAIVFLDALPEIEQDRAALAEIARVLKPQGRFVISSACSYSCEANLYKEQMFLRKMIPKGLYRRYLPGNKSWLDVDMHTIRKNLRVFHNYTLNDLRLKAEPFLAVSRYTYILRKYGALATDITYGIKGLWAFRFLFFWPAVRLDYYFGGNAVGYTLFVEFKKGGES
jgi:SAM-dependent methyltransferase